MSEKRMYFTACKSCGVMLKWTIPVELVEQKTWRSPPRECWMCSKTASYAWEDLGPTRWDRKGTADPSS